MTPAIYGTRCSDGKSILTSIRCISEQQSYFRWLHTAIGFLESTLRGAEDADFSNDGALRPRAPSSICRLHSDHARVFVSVANTHHSDHVPNPSDDVRQACAARRKRGAGRIWWEVSSLHGFHSGVFSSFGRQSAEQRGLKHETLNDHGFVEPCRLFAKSTHPFPASCQF